MCLSYTILPDFYPGDDVLQFQLRIVPKVFEQQEHNNLTWSVHRLSCWKENFWRKVLQYIETLPKYFNIHDFHIHLLHPIDSTCAQFTVTEEYHIDNDKENNVGNDLPDRILTCFCLAGHICDEQFVKKKQCYLSTAYSFGYDENEDMKCAKSSTSSMKTNNRTEITQVKRNHMLDLFYYWILTPVTRWDAARFLYLAIDPCARYPYRNFGSFDNTTTKHDELNLFSEAKRTCHDNFDTYKDISGRIPTIAHSLPPNMKKEQLAITNAEQAHAFYPLMPFVIRHLSVILSSYMPIRYLPPTFEGVVTLVGILWSWLMLCVAALSLHHLTYKMLSLGHAHNKQQQKYGVKYVTSDLSTNEKMNKTQQSSQPCENPDSDLHERMITVANHVTMLFLYSPSAIFFSVPYTESTFSAFVFFGYCIALQSLESKNHFYSIISALVWILACGTRSNGILLIIHVLSIMIGTMFASTIEICQHLIQYKWNVNFGELKHIISTIMIPYVGMICCILLLFPSLLHDYYGCQFFHDLSQEWIPSSSAITNIHTNPSSSIAYLPSWFQEITHLKTCNPFSFSLYKYVQSKHWNVGFLHYYQTKNIPNFFLAAPSIVIAIYAVYHWFRKSWMEFSILEDIESSKIDKPKIDRIHNDERIDLQDKMPSSLSIKDKIIKKVKYHTTIRYRHHAQHETWSQYLYTLLHNWETWEIYALLQLGRKHTMTSISKIDKPSLEQYLLGPLTLPFYAILGAISLVGVTVAHVEVSTRLICSTCPAFYWFCSFSCMKERDPARLNMARTNCLYRLFYMYSICGIILFPNWLRWT